jgi:predicted nuclease with TOPRIM domain
MYKDKKAQYVNRMNETTNEKEELIKMAGTAQATLANLETRLKELE